MTPQIRPDVADLSSSFFLAADKRAVAHVSAHLAQEEALDYLLVHNGGFALATVRRLVLWDRDAAKTPAYIPYDGIRDVEVQTRLIWGRLVFRYREQPHLAVAQRVELIGLTNAEVNRLAATIARRSSGAPVGAAPATTDIAAQPAVRPEPRTFEIHALGPSGSGKTVFLASLYHRLRIRRPELAFYLKSDHDSSAYLNAVHNRISDLDGGWPEASQGVQEWQFTTCVQSAAGDFEPLRFRYLDYPGGVLTNPRAARDPAIRSLTDRLRSANALLVLLDGEAVEALLAGDPRGRRYLSFDMTSSLEIAQQSRCPVHFVVTKWDLLAHRYNLTQVRDALLADENLHDLVAAKVQDTGATIRLFPVSAVGAQFAQPHADGGMRKMGGALRPHNVELPMLSVLPDFMQFAHEEIARRAATLGGPAPSTGTPAAGPTATRMTGAALRLAVTRGHPLLALIPPKVFDDAVGYATRLLAARRQGDGADPDAEAQRLMAARHTVDSEQSALELVERQCAQIVSRFETDHPASVLGGGLKAFDPALSAAVSAKP